MTTPPIVAKWQAMGPQFHSLLRIVAAGMYLLHGTMKLFAFPASVMGDGGGTVALMSQMGAGGIIEVVGGACLLLGFCTRPIAFLVAGEMAVAYWQFHFPRSPWPVMSGGEVPALYCFIFLYLSAVGPGPWSLDAKRR
jgi:putative oxidoreductase